MGESEERWWLKVIRKKVIKTNNLQLAGIRLSRPPIVELFICCKSLQVRRLMCYLSIKVDRAIVPV